MTGITFVNTPGYYYSISYFLAAMAVVRTNPETNRQEPAASGTWRFFCGDRRLYGGDGRCETGIVSSVYDRVYFTSFALYLCML